MLIALAATVIYFAQAAPESAPSSVSSVKAPTREVVASAPAADFSTTTQVAPKEGKTVAPLTVTGTPQAKAVVANNTMVCHNEPVLGSLFPKKVCATKSEIADRKAVDQAEIRKWQALRPYAAN
ncbi:MAG: hypothetical protein JSR98_20510 [Proteobacteria bacterium]|nr:hypothetical protein [Pseudomonadota bacterium]